MALKKKRESTALEQLSRAKVYDISGRVPREGDDAQDLAVLEIRIPPSKNGERLGSTVRVKQSSVDRASKMRGYRKLGFSKKTWTLTKLLSAEEFGGEDAEKLVARVMGIDSFDSLEQLNNAEEYLSGVINNKDMAENLKLDAVNMLSDVIASRVKMQEHILALAQKARNSENKQEQRKVLPPANPTQINAQAGSQVFIAASSGQGNGAVKPVEE